MTTPDDLPAPSSLTDPRDPRLRDVAVHGDVRQQEWWQELLGQPEVDADTTEPPAQDGRGGSGEG